MCWATTLWHAPAQACWPSGRRSWNGRGCMLAREAVGADGLPTMACAHHGAPNVRADNRRRLRLRHLQSDAAWRGPLLRVCPSLAPLHTTGPANEQLGVARWRIWRPATAHRARDRGRRMVAGPQGGAPWPAPPHASQQQHTSSTRPR